MQFAIRGHDITNVKNVEDLALKTQLAGIQNVQLALGISFPNMPTETANINPGMGNYFRTKLAERDVNIAILSCYINMIHPDLDVREQLLQKFEAYVKHAKYFGASMVATETGCVFPEIAYTTENFTEEAFQETVDVIKRLVEVGEKHGMLIGIEPGLNHPIHSLQKTERLIELVDSDFLGIILDPTNLITAETYPNQVDIVKHAFRLFGESICAVHMKDFVVENDRVKPTYLFQGEMQVKEIISVIAQQKPNSFVVLEETKDEWIGKAKDELNHM
ncbi:AP endonuclease [Listeria weihenstephanensis FSL R9-0317]|uniref:sugar phosphate isomerase/epimerase family protein n=1 Tax=Listeria weihenstephanensis TaxID=1006155 RepID=UPI0003E89D73|nr:sugar phosphate isomerase/epimerase [Listeria weihenstephanensis]EUJ39662.1 AP endonuclease [Listeria weihenstephanensis FSL R9-0317]